MFDTMSLPAKPTVTAPDGSDVRVLLHSDRGSMAHFELAPGQISIAVRHRTVSELWYFLSGHGQMWRRATDREEVVDVTTGVCISIPVGTEFQFRTVGDEPLAAVAVTMPPWPGGQESIATTGVWKPTVAPGTG